MCPGRIFIYEFMEKKYLTNPRHLNIVVQVLVENLGWPNTQLWWLGSASFKNIFIRPMLKRSYYSLATVHAAFSKSNLSVPIISFSF